MSAKKRLIILKLPDGVDLSPKQAAQQSKQLKSIAKETNVKFLIVNGSISLTII